MLSYGMLFKDHVQLAAVFMVKYCISERG